MKETGSEEILGNNSIYMNALKERVKEGLSLEQAVEEFKLQVKANPKDPHIQFHLDEINNAYARLKRRYQ